MADPKNPLTLNGTTIKGNSPALVDSHTGALLPGVRTCASPTDLNCVASYNFAANDPKKIGVDPTIAKLFASYPTPNRKFLGAYMGVAAAEGQTYAVWARAFRPPLASNVSCVAPTGFCHQTLWSSTIE